MQITLQFIFNNKEANKMVHVFFRTSPSSIIFFLLTTSIFTLSLISDGYSKKASSQSIIANCISDSNLQKARSKELAELVFADQKARENVFFDKMTKDEMKNFAIKDLERRKRVGEIMGEGCINTAKDYAAASLIYQHGDVP